MLNKKMDLKRLIVVTIGILVFIGCGLLGALVLQRDNTPNNTPLEKSPTGEQSIDYGPPTQQEIEDTEKHKRSLDQQKKEITHGGATSSSITPVITSADQTTVRAYISGINEDGGTCTATFKQGGYTFSKTSSAFSDSNNTVCSPITLERSDFAVNGEWSVSLRYVSSLVQGESQEVKFKVE